MAAVELAVHDVSLRHELFWLRIEGWVAHKSTIASCRKLSASADYMVSAQGNSVNPLYIDHDHRSRRNMIALVFIVLFELTRYS